MNRDIWIGFFGGLTVSHLSRLTLDHLLFDLILFVFFLIIFFGLMIYDFTRR